MDNQFAYSDEDIKRAEAIAATVGIPPKPKIVTEIQSELNRENPDFFKISSLVERDVSLAAKVLKVANSPFFSRGRIDSIHHALQILGMRTFNAILLSSALEAAVGSKTEALEKFLNHSMLTAQVAGLIARLVKEIPDYIAYTAGLFHDCGVVLMFKKFSNYVRLLDYALYPLSVQEITDKFDSVVGVEQELFLTNHCVMGYVMAKSWGLSDTILKAIIGHHGHSSKVADDEKQTVLNSILLLADLISLSSSFEGKIFSHTLSNWLEKNNTTIKKLGLTTHDIDILVAETSKIRYE